MDTEDQPWDGVITGALEMSRGLKYIEVYMVNLEKM